MKQVSRKQWAVALAAALILSLSMSAIPAFAQQPQFTVPVVIVNTSFLNVRTGPGVQYSTLTTAVGGSEFPVLGVGNDGVWYLVSTPVGIGWINIEFAVPRGNFSVVPTVNVNSIDAVLIAPAAAPSIAMADAGQGGGGTSTSASSSTVERFRAAIDVEFVNLRQSPQDNAPALSLLSAVSDRLLDYPIVGRSRDAQSVEWVAIDVPGIGVGWVEAPKVITRLSARYATVVTLQADIFGLTSGPGGGTDPNLPTLSRGAEMFLIGVSGNNQYAQVELADGRVGWLPYSVIQTRSNTTSDILRAQGDTREAMFEAQGGGDAAETTVVVPALELPHIIVNTSFLNVRSGPEAFFSVVATVSGGDRLDALGISEDGFWYLVRAGTVVGWVDTDFVVFRGSFANLPVISESAASASAEAAVQGPVAVFSTSLTLYAAPGVNFGVVGFANGPAELPIVARSADGRWVQLNSPGGFGWVLAEQVVIRGDQSLIPVVG